MATAFCCVSSRFRKIAWKFSKALCTRRCIASNTKVGSQANGANRKTSGKPSSTVSRRRESEDYKSKPRDGIACRTSLRESCAPLRRKYDPGEPAPILVTGDSGTLAHGERDGCGTQLSHRSIRRGL